MSVFDLNQFMSDGYSHWPVAYNVTEEAVKALRTEKWKEVGAQQWAPQWDGTDRIPEGYQLSIQWMDFFIRNTFGEKFKRLQVDMWKGSKELPFHNCDVNRVQMFSYLGAERWHPDAGGRLLVRNELSGVVTAIEPTRGTCVILNGLTQGYRHAVEPLTSRFAEDRIILAVDYKLEQS